MKKYIVFILGLTFLLSLVGCGSDDDAAIIKDNIPTTQTVETGNNGSSEVELYSDKIFHVGDDIPEGSYVVCCIESNYALEIDVFENEDKFSDFENAEKVSNGDYWRAIEQNALASFYVNKNEFVYINLKVGNVLLLDNGLCEFYRYDVSSSNTLYSGLYVVGEDISANNANIECITSYLKITVFENTDRYLAYHQSKRTSSGEERDAIENNSIYSEFIYKNDIVSIDLEDGMILMLDDGIGEYTTNEG